MARVSFKGEGSHPVEAYDARERESKAKWHYDRAGKQRGATLSKGIHNDYQAQLIRSGVKDSQGNQTPLVRKTDENKQQPLNHTKLLNVGHDDPNVKTGFAFRD